MAPHPERLGEPLRGDAGGEEAHPVGERVAHARPHVRTIRRGEDPREAEQDGFDVDQCLIDLGLNALITSPDYMGPRFRFDAPFTGNKCGNSGGVDQNIYGNRVSVP